MPLQADRSAATLFHKDQVLERLPGQARTSAGIDGMTSWIDEPCPEVAIRAVLRGLRYPSR
jgi:hypothetical protein